MPDGSIEVDEERTEGTEHVHVKGFTPAVIRKTKKKQKLGITCDMTKMSSLDATSKPPTSAPLYPCAAPMKPIARHLQALSAASIPELCNGNKSVVPGRRQCKSQTAEETSMRQPWIPNGKPLPCQSTCLDLLQEYLIAVDKSECKANLDNSTYQKLVNLGFWGDIQSIQKTSTIVTTVIVIRANRKIARESAKVTKAIMVDASGAIRKGGSLFMPMKCLPKGTSGESGQAASPVVVGWVVTMSKISGKGGMSAEAIQHGLTTVMKWLKVKYTDVCCDQDDATIAAARALGMRIHLDKEHIERLVEAYSKHDCKDPKAPTDLEREAIDRNKQLFRHWQKPTTPQEETKERAYVLNSIPNNTIAHQYFIDHIFDKSPLMMCEFGRSHLPSFYHSSNQIETFFDKFCNGAPVLPVMLLHTLTSHVGGRLHTGRH